MSSTKRSDAHSLTVTTLQSEPRRFARVAVASGLWLALVLLADQACTAAGSLRPGPPSARSRRENDRGSW